MSKLTPKRKINIAEENEDNNLRREFMEDLPLAVLEGDARGFITYINDAGLSLFGYSRNNLDSNFHILDLLSAERGKLKKDDFLRSLLGGRDIDTTLKAKKGNATFTAAIYSTPVKGQGKTVGFRAVLMDVTRQRRAEEALIESEGRYRMLFQNANDAILTMEGNRFIDCNAKTLAVFNCTKKEIIGKHPWDLSPEYQPNGRLSKEESLEKINLALTGKPQFYEWKYCRHSGPIFDGEVSLDRLEIQGRIVIQAIIRDVTLRKRAEEGLKRSEEKYRLLIESSSDAIFVIQENVIRFANQRTVKMLGYFQKEILEKPFTELIHKEDRLFASGLCLHNTEENGWSDLTPFRCIDKRGRIKWVEINTVPINWEEKPAMIIFARDITDRKKIEDNLQKSYRRNMERVQKALDTTIEAIGTIVETRDPYTSGHQKRVAVLASAIAEEMKLFEEQRYAILTAATVHDVGKIYIPAEILSKPIQLTRVEKNLMKTHPQIGYDILKNIEFSVPIAAIVLQHHERIDGSGYPQKLSGKKNILIEARIIAVADVVEAMASHRPYRPTLGLDKALEEISSNSGITYDADVVDACIRLFTKKGFKLPHVS